MSLYDVIIIGSDPAGIYCIRAGLLSLVIEGKIMGVN